MIGLARMALGLAAMRNWDDLTVDEAWGEADLHMKWVFTTLIEDRQFQREYRRILRECEARTREWKDGLRELA